MRHSLRCLTRKRQTHLTEGGVRVSWNYRIVNCPDGKGGRYYALFEVFYDDDGKPEARTAKPISFVTDEDEGSEGVVRSLEMALKGATERPVLMDEDIGSKE